jgi:hypothetical protein
MFYPSKYKNLNKDSRLKIFNYRLVIFALSIIFGVVFAIPSLMQTDNGKKYL